MFVKDYILILLFSTHFLTPVLGYGDQNIGDFLKKEKEADALSSSEKHEEAFILYQGLLDHTSALQDMDLKANLKLKAGKSLMHLGQNITAMSFFFDLIQNHSSYSGKEILLDAMTGLGQTYEYTGKHDSAFYWYMETLNIVNQTNDTLRKVTALRNIAQLLRVLRKLDEAKNYLNQAVELAGNINNHKLIANIYNEKAYLFELSENLDSAAYYYQKLIDVSRNNYYLKGESVGYNNLASVYDKEHKYKEALSLKYMGLHIDREIGDNYGLMTSYKSLATTYFHMRDYQNALSSLDIAAELCDTSWLPDLSAIKLQYYEIFKAMGDSEQALENYEAYVSLRNIIHQAETLQKADELLTRYEAEQKEKQIQLLEQSNLLNKNRIRKQWLIIGSLFMLGLFLVTTGWFWLRSKNQKLKQMNLELQHFLFRDKHDKCRIENHSETDPSEIYKDFGLTGRESEILYHLGKGCSNAVIAEKLFVSENTVKFHIKNIYIKLDVKNRIQATLRCNQEYMNT